MRETYREDGKYWVSPYNFEKEVRDSQIGRAHV